jgi:hypothetical protein
MILIGQISTSPLPLGERGVRGAREGGDEKRLGLSTPFVDFAGRAAGEEGERERHGLSTSFVDFAAEGEEGEVERERHGLSIAWDGEGEHFWVGGDGARHGLSVGADAVSFGRDTIFGTDARNSAKRALILLSSSSQTEDDEDIVRDLKSIAETEVGTKCRKMSRKTKVGFE